MSGSASAPGVVITVDPDRGRGAFPQRLGHHGGAPELQMLPGLVLLLDGGWSPSMRRAARASAGSSHGRTCPGRTHRCWSPTPSTSTCPHQGDEQLLACPTSSGGPAWPPVETRVAWSAHNCGVVLSLRPGR